MTTNLRILSKNDILQIFKKPISPAKTLESLISALPDVFSKERIEPENSKRHLPPNPAEVFVQVSPLQKPNRPMEKAPRKKVFIQKSPFSNSGYAEDPSLRVWYYIDEADRIQGPFTSLEMDHWFDSGFFFNELLIRFKEQNDFIKLVDLFGKTEQPQNYRIIPQQVKHDHTHQKPKLVDVNIWEKIKPTGNTKEEAQKPAEKSNSITQDNAAKEHKAHPVKTDKAPAKDKAQEPVTKSSKEEKKEEKPTQGMEFYK
jgi:GYF domain.